MFANTKMNISEKRDENFGEIYAQNFSIFRFSIFDFLAQLGVKQFFNFLIFIVILSTEFFSLDNWRPTSRGLASVGDLVSQMYRFKNQLPSTKPTLKFA
jgi:hypothetical protein